MSFSGTKGYLTKPKPGVMLNPLHPLSRGLVGYWLFNEGSGSKAYDISGHGNHGTLTNISPNAQGSGWGGSKCGGGIRLDGNDDHVDCGNNDSLNSTGIITIVARVCLSSISSDNPIVSKDNYSGERGYYFRFRDTGVMQFYGNDGTGKYHTTAAAVAANVLADVAIVSDGINYIFYKDGVEFERDPNALGAVSTSNNLFIGKQITDPITYLDDAIDFVYIYNRALSAEEIKTLYHNPFCNLLQVPLRRYSVAVPPVGAIMNQFQRANIGADLYDGGILA